MSDSPVFDWKHVSALFQKFMVMGSDQQADFLKTLDTDAPEYGEILRQLIQRQTDETGFRAVRSRAEELVYFKPGERVGNWVIEGLIGAGGMGQVYQARRNDGFYDQTVALKLAPTLEPGK